MTLDAAQVDRNYVDECELVEGPIFRAIEDASRDRNPFKLVSSVNQAAECYLKLSMLDFRWYGRADRGRQWLSTSSEIVNRYLLSALDDCRDVGLRSERTRSTQPLGAHRVWYPFATAMLRDDFDLGTKLANWVEVSPPFVVGASTIDSNVSRLFYSPLVDGHEVHRGAIEQIRDHLSKPALYVQFASIGDAILRRDHASFQEYVDAAETSFRSRDRMQVRANFTRDDFGIAGFGACYFDYAMVIFIKIARHLGMTCSVPGSSILPVEFVGKA